MKLFRVLCVFALLATFVALEAYAETQSVKVSGDITVHSFWRRAYDLQTHPTEPDSNVVAFTNRTGFTGPDETWWMSTTEVQVDANMTDNVSTCVRLVNERDWNVATKATNVNTPISTEYFGAEQREFDVGVDLAYVTLKDFIYAPLTLTIGRQDLWMGKGFIIGSNQRLDKGNYVAGAAAGYPKQGLQGATVNGINAPEYTTYNAFDAVKAVLDYNPWTLTSIYSKIWENSIADSDDIDLYGTNVGYKFDQYKAEAEGYWFFKKDNSVTKWRTIDQSNDVHTIGLRGNLDPIDVMTINVEGAYQFGQYTGARQQEGRRDRSAWAFDAGFEWRYLADKFSWKPKFGTEYIFYSGNKEEENVQTIEGAYNGWDRMFRGKTDSKVREWIGTYYATARFPFIASANRNQPQTADASYQNQHQVVFTGSVQPIESLTLKGNCNLFWAHEPISMIAADGSIRASAVEKQYIGTELDLEAIWDYTEDVSFGVLGGWFFPGDLYGDLSDAATDLVGTVKVNF